MFLHIAKNYFYVLSFVLIQMIYRLLWFYTFFLKMCKAVQTYAMRTFNKSQMESNFSFKFRFLFNSYYTIYQIECQLSRNIISENILVTPVQFQTDLSNKIMDYFKCIWMSRSFFNIQWNFRHSIKFSTFEKMPLCINGNVVYVLYASVIIIVEWCIANTDKRNNIHKNVMFTYWVSVVNEIL